MGVRTEVRAPVAGGDSSREIILVRFDRLRLGGSQQDDAKILLKHYRAMSGGPAGGGSKATAFVSGFKTNPVDAHF